MIVMKFGGSALQTAKRIQDVASIVQSHMNERPILVLSAMGSTTDDLIAAAKRSNTLSCVEEFHRDMIARLALPKALIDPILCEMYSAGQQPSTPQSYDYLLSFGERLSVRIFSAYLHTRGIEAAHFDGWDIGIVSSSEHTCAQIVSETYERIPQALQHIGRTVPVITGFIAKSQEGFVTTLGRGGSDLTASVVAKALMVREVQLWKDVSGILTADPRLVPDARPISHLSFLEASLLARYGAKVLHPDSVLPAMSAQIPVRVKNYQDPAHPGTVIQSSPSQRSRSVVAIAHSSQGGGKSCVALIGSCDQSEVVEALLLEGIRPFEVCVPKLIVSDGDVKRCVEALHRRFCTEGVS